MSFPQTRWTLITTAGQDGNPAADDALAELCKLYWYPVYAFIRRSGRGPHDSEDLTQEFFVRFLQKRGIASANPVKGRFRSFLLTSVKHCLADQAELGRAQKRGGAGQLAFLDVEDAERRYASDIASHETPERVFEREWARTLMQRVQEELRSAYAREGRAHYFDRMKTFLPGGGEGDYEGIGEQLGMRDGTLKVAVHRLRRRYREVFRAEIADLVTAPEMIDDEIQHLLQVLRG
jgi:RNA polymerase sigma-70 factor (ECF subfamily)